jgi:hypothetical protein
MDYRIMRLLEKANAMEGIDTALIDALDAQKDKATTRYASYRRLNLNLNLRLNFIRFSSWLEPTGIFRRIRVNFYTRRKIWI